MRLDQSYQPKGPMQAEDAYPVGVELLVSFMKIRTSEAFGFPSVPIDTVKSKEPSV